MKTVQSTESKWLTAKECIRLLDCDHRKLKAILAENNVRQRDGCGYRRYWREDVERVSAPPDNA